MLKEYMLGLGYTNKEIDNILNIRLFYGVNENFIYGQIESVYNFLLEFGFSHETILKITKKFPRIYGTNVKQKMKDMASLGYENKSIIKMIKTYPPISTMTLEDMQDKINFMLELGYQYKDVIIITKKFPHLYELGKSNIIKKIKELESLGFTKKEILRMTTISPQMYSYNISSTKEKIEIVKSFGFTLEEIIFISVKFPALYSQSNNTIREKLEFYTSMNLSQIIITNPNCLMQSIDLTYARYMFLQNNGYEAHTQFTFLLFCGQKIFNKKYGKMNEDLLLEYPYTNDIKEKQHSLVKEG